MIFMRRRNAQQQDSLSALTKGNTAFNYDEHKMTKREKDKLSKFKCSSKTNNLIKFL